MPQFPGQLLLLLLLLCGVDQIMAATTCLSQPVLAATLAGTAIAAAAIALVIVFLLQRCRPRTPLMTAVNSNKTTTDVEAATRTAEKLSAQFDTLTIERRNTKRKQQLAGQPSMSNEDIRKLSGSVDVCIDGRKGATAAKGLGFEIRGSALSGIFVSKLHTNASADATEHIRPGDRIRSITVDFDRIVYEDAVTLLSYAAPYQVRLELERPLNEGIERAARFHPLFRSNSLIVDKSSAEKKEEPVPPTAVTIETPPPMEEATPKRHEREQEVLEKSMIIEEVVSSSSLHAEIEEEEEGEQPNNHAAPVPGLKMDWSDYSSGCGEESAGKTTASSIEDDEQPALPTPPDSSTSESLLKQPNAQHTTGELQSSKPPVAVSKMPRLPSGQAPQMREARVSRIPQRSDSLKTPVVERKLPRLPASALEPRTTDEQPKADVWSRLYLEQRRALRPTRATPSDMPPRPPSAAPIPTHSVRESATVIDNQTGRSGPGRSTGPGGGGASLRYGSLDRERSQRLTNNEEALERQREQLRLLGVI